MSASPAYQECLRGLLRLHQMLLDGRETTPEYDALCESLGDAWHLLTAAERERLEEESLRLYAVSDRILAGGSA